MNYVAQKAVCAGARTPLTHTIIHIIFHAFPREHIRCSDSRRNVTYAPNASVNVRDVERYGRREAPLYDVHASTRMSTNTAKPRRFSDIASSIAGIRPPRNATRRHDDCQVPHTPLIRHAEPSPAAGGAGWHHRRLPSAHDGRCHHASVSRMPVFFAATPRRAALSRRALLMPRRSSSAVHTRHENKACRARREHSNATPGRRRRTCYAGQTRRTYSARAVAAAAVAFRGSRITHEFLR